VPLYTLYTFITDLFVSAISDESDKTNQIDWFLYLLIGDV